MTTLTVEAFVNQTLCETLEVSESDFTPQTDLLEELGADSLMILEVMARIESGYKINIDQSKLAEMTSAEAICDIIYDAIRLVA